MKQEAKQIDIKNCYFGYLLIYKTLHNRQKRYRQKVFRLAVLLYTLYKALKTCAGHAF